MNLLCNRKKISNQLNKQKILNKNRKYKKLQLKNKQENQGMLLNLQCIQCSKFQMIKINQFKTKKQKWNNL